MLTDKESHVVFPHHDPGGKDRLLGPGAGPGSSSRLQKGIIGPNMAYSKILYKPFDIGICIRMC